jgi:hypothetical protein
MAIVADANIAGLLERARPNATLSSLRAFFCRNVIHGVAAES